VPHSRETLARHIALCGQTNNIYVSARRVEGTGALSPAFSLKAFVANYNRPSPPRETCAVEEDHRCLHRCWRRRGIGAATRHSKQSATRSKRRAATRRSAWRQRATTAFIAPTREGRKRRRARKHARLYCVASPAPALQHWHRTFSPWRGAASGDVRAIPHGDNSVNAA